MSFLVCLEDMDISISSADEQLVEDDADDDGMSMNITL
jgi:hypothetical protein